MPPVAILLATCLAVGQYRGEINAAQADYALYGSGARYLSLADVPARTRPQVIRALSFWLPHLSREVALEHQLPVAISPTVLRIDIQKLGWGRAAWTKVVQQYPYFQYHRDALIIRGDWLLRITADAQESAAYYDLLYAGTRIPTNRQDFLETFGVDLKASERLQARIIINEGDSGVAKRTRLVVYRNATGGHFFETFDSIEGTDENDPIEQLTGTLKSDGSELICAMPKFSIANGIRGCAQAYLLLDGAGKRINEANVRLVEDHTKTLGISAIRTPASCVSCHNAINGPPANALRTFITAGVEAYGGRKSDSELIESFYLSDIGKEVNRANEDFGFFCASACGLQPAQAVAEYRAALGWYDQPLDLAQAARENRIRAEGLRLALAYYSEAHGPDPDFGRAAGLAHGIPVPRRIFEDVVYYQCRKAINLWKVRRKP